MRGVLFLKKLKPILGALLILLSMAGLLFWELEGRDTVMMDQVLVAGEDIQKGTTLSGSMLVVKGVPKSNLIEGALTPADAALIHGKVASQFIPKNDQIIMVYFRENEFYMKRDESIFVIDPGWIAMRSSALRRGDVVDIYGSNGIGLIGTYRIAYVKDDAEREVRNAGEETSETVVKDILERPDSTSVIDHIEIITTYREYENLMDLVSGTGGTTPAALIIVQRGESIDT
jgi:hypothetical protein